MRKPWPPPNPISEGLMTYWFDVSAPDRTWQIELFDYSGELVDARKAADPEALAAKLQNHLKTMDGLLVLAAIPHADGPQDRDHQDLQLLKEAFIALRVEAAQGPMLTKPVALLINKWDRQANDVWGDVETECGRLQNFLDDDRHSTWRAVAQAIQNSTVAECFEKFPVSAFGQHERVAQNGQTIERPIQTVELPAFGVEDPFVWAARTVDETDLANYEQQTQALWWIGWPKNIGRMVRKGEPLIRRFAPGTEDRLRAETACGRCLRIATARWTQTVLAVLMILILTEFAFDTIAHRRAMAAFQDDKSTPEQINEAEAWFSGYSTSFGVWHLGLSNLTLSRNEAVEILRDFHEKYEAKLWAQVEPAPTEAEKYVAATRYFDKFPRGRHANEAEALIAEHERRLRARKNTDWLVLQEYAVGTHIQSGTTEDLERSLSILDQPPHPKDIDEDFSRRRAELHGRLSNRLTALLLKQDWERFDAGFQEAMQQRRLDQAAKMLHQREPVEENLLRARRQFAKSLPNELRQTVEDFAQKRYWEDAQTLLANLARDHVHWPAEMRFDGDAKLFHDQQQRVTDAHDRSLYDRFRQLRTATAAKDYLERQSPGPMHTDVKKYVDYLEARKQKHQFTVVLEAIEWSDTYTDHHNNTIRFEVENQVVEEKKVKSTKAGETGKIGQVELKGPRALESDVSLNVKIVYVSKLFGFIDAGLKDSNGGESSEKVKISQLDGYRQKLKAGEMGQCFARYKLIGGEIARNEPEIPVWRRQ